MSSTWSFLPMSLATFCAIEMSKPTISEPSAYSKGLKAALVPILITSPVVSSASGTLIASSPSAGMKAFTSAS